MEVGFNVAFKVVKLKLHSFMGHIVLKTLTVSDSSVFT